MTAEFLFTWSFPIPLLIGDPLICFPISIAVKLIEIAGNLRVLVSGTHTIAVLGSISWSALGFQKSPPLSKIIPAGDDISMSCTSLGVGALDCYITLWFQVPGV